jgi:acetyl esterase/lipase
VTAAEGCAGTPLQPPLPDTISHEAKAALAPLLALPTNRAEPDISQMRAFADSAQAQMSKRQLQRYRVKIESARVAAVPVRTFIPDDGPVRSTDTVLLNLHGGGFMVDSGSLTENIPLAALTRTRIVSVLYRLAPEHPFPAAVDDAIAVYRELLKSYRPGRIALYGTSAGATLSAEALVRMKTEGLPMPAVLGFFSAAVDFSQVADSEQYLPTINCKSLPDALSPYAGKSARRDPALSPLYSDLSGFPRTLMISGTRDLMLSQTSLFHRALLRAGVAADLVVFEAMPHAHWAWLDIPESTEAFEIMAGFFNRQLYP